MLISRDVTGSERELEIHDRGPSDKEKSLKGVKRVYMYMQGAASLEPRKVNMGPSGKEKARREK